MTELDVVNEMLGTMGEAPLATLTAPHALRGSAQRTLRLVNDELQSLGWWFNRETLKLSPSNVDGTVYLPGDFLGVRVPHGSTAVERAGRLYDTAAGDWLRKEITVELVRRVAFADAPYPARAAIGAEAIKKFQRNYDGDTTKTRDIREEYAVAIAQLRAEETRQVKANRIAAHPRLSYLKSRVFARRWGG